MNTSDSQENALVRSIVLMSALSTAADVVAGMAERRRGFDPSSQEEPEVARPYLRDAAAELDEHLTALRAGRALLEESGANRIVRLARAANEVLLLNRVVRLLHGMHQRLLSLYPSVPEDAVERARLLEGAFARERDRLGSRYTPGLIEEAEVFNAAIRALGAGA